MRNRCAGGRGRDAPMCADPPLCTWEHVSESGRTSRTGGIPAKIGVSFAKGPLSHVQLRPARRSWARRSRPPGVRRSCGRPSGTAGAACEARIMAQTGGVWKSVPPARRPAAARLVPRLRRASEDDPAPSSPERRHLNAPTRTPRPPRVRRAPGPERQDFCAHPHCLTLRSLHSLCSLRLHLPFQGGWGRSRPCRLSPEDDSDSRVGSPRRRARTHRCWP